MFVLSYVGAKQFSSDYEALRGLRRDPCAICALYDRHVARLTARLIAVGADRDVAFEIVQETFARALERGHRVRVPRDGSAWPWLWSVARNLFVDQKRRGVVDAAARRRLRMEAVAFDPNDGDALIDRMDAAALGASLGDALDHLPSSQREAVVSHVIDGAAYRELARSSDVSEELVRARVSRGLRALRLRLGGGKP